MAKAKASKVQPHQMCVFRDHVSRTCIQVDRTDDEVKFIPMDITGFSVVTLDAKEFDEIYKPLVDYPVDKACRLYASYTKTAGATKEALEYLQRHTPITEEDFNMATRKAALKAIEPEVKVKSKSKASTKEVPFDTKPQKAKAPAVKAAPKGKAPAKPAAKTKAEPKAKASGEKKRTASAAFCELIAEGKLSDDSIFAKVQKEFGLSDDKRSYVKWYRNKMIKDGLNPPGPK
jgi:hypothetical protein